MRKRLTSVLLLFCLWFMVPATAQDSSKLNKIENKRDRSERKEERLRKKAEKKQHKLERQEKKTHRRENKLNREQHKLEREKENRETTSTFHVSVYKKEEYAENTRI